MDYFLVDTKKLWRNEDIFKILLFLLLEKGTFVIDNSVIFAQDLEMHVHKNNKLNYWYVITKTRLCNFDPLKPHFYIVKLGFTGVYIIFLISAQNIDCGYSLEPPRRGGSNEYPQSMF